MNNSSTEYSYKLILAGQYGVGKTSLLRRFTEGTFDPCAMRHLGIPSVSSTQITKWIEVASQRVKLMVWDIAKAERYSRIPPVNYRNCSGVLIVYDVTRRHSFEEIAIWHSEVLSHAPPNSCLLLVGNKCDLEAREVQFSEGKALADSLGMKFVETSAKTSQNVEQTFTLLATDIVARDLKESALAQQARSMQSDTDSWCVVS